MAPLHADVPAADGGRDDVHSATAIRKLTLPAGLVVAAGLVWLTFWSVRETQRQAAAVAGAAASSGPSVRSTITHQRVDAAAGNKRLWSLAFDQIDLQASGHIVTASGLRDGVVYDPDEGKSLLRVTAQRAEFDTERRNFTLSGGVTAVFSSGTIATMDQAEYMEAERKLVCRGNIVVQGEDYTGSAPVAIVWVDKDLVTCPEGGVVVTSDGTKLVGREIEYDTASDRFTVHGVTGVFDIEAVKKRAREEGEGQ